MDGTRREIQGDEVMAGFSWYTDDKPHISTYLNGAPKKRYLVVDGIAVVGRAVMHYKPNRKGGHRHNHVYNKCHKYVFRGKNARKIDRNDKKEFVRIFYIGLKLNRNFGEFLHKIFHKNNNSTAQHGKGKKHV